MNSSAQRVNSEDFFAETPQDDFLRDADGVPTSALKKKRQRKPMDEMAVLSRTLRLLGSLDPDEANWVLSALVRKFKAA